MTRNQKGVVFIPFLIIVVILGAVGFLVYQNYQLKQLVPKKTQEIKTSPTPTPASLYISKIDASLSFLQECRKTGGCPEDVKDIVASESVSVSIRFTHELTNSEIDTFENLGVQFLQVGGQISKSGTIYGADIPWNKISDVEKEDVVLRIESTWQPGVFPPTN